MPRNVVENEKQTINETKCQQNSIKTHLKMHKALCAYMSVLVGVYVCMRGCGYGCA